MKAILIAAVLSTIMASESSAQAKPRVDTSTLTVFRPNMFAKDSVAWADSATLRTLATQKSPNPSSAHVMELVIRNDSAFVTMFTDVLVGPGSTTATLMQRLRFERRKGTWTLVPERGWASDSAAAAAPPPRRPPMTT